MLKVKVRSRRFSALDTIKREEFEQRNVLKFLNNSFRAK